MSYFIARLTFAQQGVSGSSDQVLIHAQNSSFAMKVLDELETYLKKDTTHATGSTTELADPQEKLFTQPRLIPISKTTYLEMKRVLPAYTQSGLHSDDDEARVQTCARLRPLAQIVSAVLAREASVSVSVELLEQSLFEATRQPACTDIFAQGLAAPDARQQTRNAGEYGFGPRIQAHFQPQAWQNNCAVDIDGAFEQDVTASVLGLDLRRLVRLEDGSESAEALVIHHYDGPSHVRVVDAVRDYFAVSNLAEITQELLDSARIRASVDPSRLRVEILAPRLDTFRLGDNPYSVEELKATNWEVDCIVPVPAHSTYSDSVLERAISKVVTGSETALTDIQYEQADESYGPDFAALRIRGRVTNPDMYFEVSAEAATPRAREMRLFLNMLTTSDVFQMTTARSTRRYHILAADQSKLLRLSQPGVTQEALERLGLVGDCAVEYELSEDNQDAPESGPEVEGFFSLPELFTARHEDDNTWTLELKTEQVNLCFF